MMTGYNPSVPPPERLVPLLEQAIPQVMLQNSVPGLSAVLFSDTAIVWSQGFGVSNTLTQKPVTTEAIFEAASLSKPVTAYAALKLCAQGKLALDRSLATYLSEDDELAASKITLQQVLSHTTGLPNWRGRGQPLQLHAAPGARFGYSGEGYLYLQRVMERITGQAFNDILRREVFAPLKMASSSFIWREDFVAKLAYGHEADGSLVEKEPFHTANAAYTLYTTAEDFARFMQAVLTPDDPMARQMLTPQIKVDDLLDWGLGWGLYSSPAGTTCWHWGNNTWFTNFVLGWRQQRTGLILMTNSVFGLEACRDIIATALGEDYPAFAWVNSVFR